MSESDLTESVLHTASPVPGSVRKPMHAGSSNRRMPAQVEKWMAVIREIDREQQNLRFGIQARGETAASSSSAKVRSPYELKIDESHRVLNSPASRGGYAFYVALIVGLLATTCGIARFIVYESALPFGLTVSGPTGNRDLNRSVISPGLEQSSNLPAARPPDSQTSDRNQVHDTMVRDVARGAPVDALQKPNISAVFTKPVSTAPLRRLTRQDSTVAPQRAAPVGSAVKEAWKLTPTPETRPTTIEGWTLREVVNGTAVIEGPNGVWRVMPGQMVPGVGRVDSIVRWGNRLVVATSRGLISTP